MTREEIDGELEYDLEWNTSLSKDIIEEILDNKYGLYNILEKWIIARRSIESVIDWIQETEDTSTY